MSARRPAQTGQTAADVLRREVLKAKRRPVGHERLCAALEGAGISFQREFRAVPPRQWRFDLAIPAERPWLLVEVHGGVYVQGGHTRGEHFTSDREKANSAQLAGYMVLEFTTAQVKDGTALRTIQQAMERRSEAA